MYSITTVYVSLASFMQCAYPQESYSEVLGDGSHGDMEYFTCANGYGAFVPISGVQKDDRFGDTSLPSSSSTTPSFPSIQHLGDGPPKLLIRGPQQSRQPTSPLTRGVHESASAEVQPIQETHESLQPSTSLPHSVVVDSPFQRTRSSPASTATQQSPGVGSVGGHLGYSPPMQPSSSSGGKVDCGSAAFADPASEEDHEIQPLLEVGDEHVYYLRFAGDLGGLIVGRGGSNVRIVEEESYAKVHVMPKRPVTEDVRVLVVGTKERCMKAIKLLAEQLKHKTANLQKYCETMDLTDAEAGKVVGQNGTTKQMIEVYSGAVLQVERRPEGMAGLFGVGKRKCKIYGSCKQVEKAKSLISDIQQGKDVSYLQLLFAFSQMLRSMPQGVSVQNHLVDESEQDEVHSILGPLLKL